MFTRFFKPSSLQTIFRKSTIQPIPRIRFLSAMASPPQLENVKIDIDSEAIAIITYNRPKNANALNTPVLKVNRPVPLYRSPLTITTGRPRRPQMG
jgi:hypothetical protein